MKLDQTEISSLEYFLTFYSRRRKYFRHNSNFHQIQGDSRRLMIDELNDSKDNHFPYKFKESGNHNQPRSGEHFHVSYSNTNRADSSMKIPWLQWKIPDAVPNSLTIPWFVKLREFFKFPDHSLILLIAVNLALATKKSNPTSTMFKLKIVCYWINWVQNKRHRLYCYLCFSIFWWNFIVWCNMSFMKKMPLVSTILAAEQFHKH